MTYIVILASQPQKFLEELKNRKLLLQFQEALNALSEDPSKGKALVGPLKGFYSWRVSDWRILYEILEKEVNVYILRITHRKKVYKK